MEIYRDQERCNGCMRCVDDCVAGVWRKVDNEPVPGYPALCNLCSHCIAVCPQQAITHTGLADKGTVTPVDEDILTPSVYEEIVKTRRSVRRYKQKAVDPAVIESVLDLARFSPTSSNIQHVEYVVITDKARLEAASRQVFSLGVRLYKWSNSAPGKMLFRLLGRTRLVAKLNRYLGGMNYYIEQANAGRDYILHGAPVLILVCAPTGAAFASENSNIAATNIMNYAHAMGLGTCYIGFLSLMLKRSRKLRKRLLVPRDRTVYASIILGHPVYAHARSVHRKSPCVQWVK
ncbi:MAG: nitroreductase family protein [Thermodesulfobacteriota bacterium]|nr:nitroreductase family protein [Thermodesulfobacteriota bacterium]